MVKISFYRNFYNVQSIGEQTMDFKEVKDSGERQKFSTGAVRDTQKGKGRFDLLPPRALKRIAKHFENGAIKYGDRNWEKGMPFTRYIDSSLRHLFAILEGKNDEDHKSAVAWNMLCLIELEERIESGLISKELDDLPKDLNTHSKT